ncbi:dolichyldiphosphatase 1-like isoform X2 [Dysidea avara]|uniref:dolichyldiphosphatase 1-like isoform X2 n=1 Tax=Dysidea avara TaxID=196820 RepID=UPI003320CD77
MSWKNIGLTCVHFPEGDLVGKLLAYSSLTPITIVVSFLTLIFFKRDIHTIFYFLGILLNESSNFVLKHVIKESRPPGAAGNHSLYGEYGMPSSHAQFMAFFATYLTLFLWIRIHSLSSGHMDVIWKAIATFTAQVMAVIVCVSRVYLIYHTTSQVMWGALIGIVTGCCWFIIVQYFLTPVFPDIVCNPIGEFFMLRDCTLIPNVLWFEYTSMKSEAKTRLRKIR